MTLHDEAPTTAEVRAAYVRDGYSGEAFDLWLAEHDAEKWDEGHGAPQYRTNLNGDYLGKTKNPYREQS